MENTNYEALAKAILTEDAALTEGLLDTLYRGGGRCDAVLDEACRYSLMAGGKRVRPALTLEFCRLFGGDPQKALPFAADVESGVYEHPGYGLCTVTVEEGKAFLQYGVMCYELRQGDGELIGYWKSPLVAQDYDSITVRKDGDDLLINTGENILWLPFKKKQ